jgi:hypothetical protein
MKNIPAIIILLIISCGSVTSTETSDVGKLLESKEYVFIAQTAYPARGSSVSLAGGNYELKVILDSVSVYLPFYGRANDISAGRTGGPIELNTKEFSYKLEKKKSRWEVTFTPTNQSAVRQMNLSVSDNGFADLQVVSTNKDNMNYHGNVEAYKK